MRTLLILLGLCAFFLAQLWKVGWKGAFSSRKFLWILLASVILALITFYSWFYFWGWEADW